MSFRPSFSRDRLWAGIAVLILSVSALIVARNITRHPLGPKSVLLGGISLLLIAVAALLIYRLWSLHTLDYWVQRDAIHILWLGEEAIIPLEDIQDIRSVEAEPSPNWFHWPTQWLHTDAKNRVWAYATQPPRQCLTIITDTDRYLISPVQQKTFIAAWQERKNFGPARSLKQITYLAPWRQHWLLRDRTAQTLLLGGLLLGLLFLASVAWRFPQLPATIALHFNARGAPDLLSPRRTILLLPGIALSVGFLNAAIGFALYDYQRYIAYLLWGVSVLLQGAAFLIASHLITLAVGH
ncbi:MAG: hypothetical protein DSY55_03740 [Clostridia bacterium]|nr:MAG: hypothetical protein DSY55_03740 [Clostridia bacterium]